MTKPLDPLQSAKDALAAQKWNERTALWAMSCALVAIAQELQQLNNEKE